MHLPIKISPRISKLNKNWTSYEKNALNPKPLLPISCKLLPISSELVLISFKLLPVSSKLVLISSELVLISSKLVLISFKLVLISFKLVLIILLGLIPPPLGKGFSLIALLHVDTSSSTASLLLYHHPLSQQSSGLPSDRRNGP